MLLWWVYVSPRPSWIAKCTVIGLSIATAMSPSLRRLPSGPDATATVKRSPWACSLRRRCPRANVKTRSWLASFENCSSYPIWVVEQGFGVKREACSGRWSAACSTARLLVVFLSEGSVYGCKIRWWMFRSTLEHDRR